MHSNASSQNVFALTPSERASSYFNALERILAIRIRFNALGEAWLLALVLSSGAPAPICRSDFVRERTGRFADADRPFAPRMKLDAFMQLDGGCLCLFHNNNVSSFLMLSPDCRETCLDF